MIIRPATEADWPLIWSFFAPIAAAGDTYGFDREITEAQAHRQWLELPRQTYVVEVSGEILGSYYIKANNGGPGSHVCNCGYMTAAEARGHGLATAMCEHSQEQARTFGFKAMQFNFVASSNEGAVRLWHRLGFETVGRLPRAFSHPELGYVDALVMYKWLAEEKVTQS